MWENNINKEIKTECKVFENEEGSGESEDKVNSKSAWGSVHQLNDGYKSVNILRANSKRKTQIFQCL